MGNGGRSPPSDVSHEHVPSSDEGSRPSPDSEEASLGTGGQPTALDDEREPSPFEVLLAEGFASLLGKNDGRLNTKLSDMRPDDLARRLAQNVGGEDALLHLLDTLQVDNPKVFDSRPRSSDEAGVSAPPADAGDAVEDVDAREDAPEADPEDDPEDGPAGEDGPVSTPSTSGPKRISFEELQSFHEDPNGLAPAVRPCDTPNDSDTVQHLTSDRIVRAYGGRRFRNFENVARVLKGAKFVNSGAPLDTLSRFTSMRRSRRGQVQPPSKKYLDKVHVDILFGDVVANLGYRYALLLVDRATKYIWIYGLKSLTSGPIIDAFCQFRADAGGLPKQFRCDCDQKLMGGDARRWIYRNHSKILGAPAGRQSSNGLVERAWQTIRDMARGYLVDAGMPRRYWFFACEHAARMLNMQPGSVNGKLTSPFELVHRVAPDVRTWFPLFSIVYFYKTTDTEIASDRANFMANAMVGIAVGRSNKSNSLRIYSPSTSKYYESDVYKFDPSRRPSNEWPNKIQYDGGLYVDLLRDTHNNNVPEPYPPGMPIKFAKDDGSIVNGIVSSIPIRTTAGDAVPDMYLLQCPDGSTVRKSLAEMDALADTPANKVVDTSSVLPSVTSLPIWLQHGSKVSMFKDDEYHKGFIIMASDGTFRFSCRRQLSSRQESWGVNLPDFATAWPRLTCDNTLLPSWGFKGYSKLGLKPTSNPFDRHGQLVTASHVSARGLKQGCPKSLREALEQDSVDRDILQQYKDLRLKKGAPKAIPTMCVLTVKTDENLNPDRAKSRIVVLGNLEDRYWAKSDRYAPVLQYSSLRLLTSMAVEKRRRLKQGDFKNAFVQATLPDDELTIVRPPMGDPDAGVDEFWLLKKSLYGLCRAPRHWYDKMSKAMLDMGLKPSAHDPCLFIGVPSTPDSPAADGDKPLHVGIYVDDFVYFSEDTAVETRSSGQNTTTGISPCFSPRRPSLRTWWNVIGVPVSTTIRVSHHTARVVPLTPSRQPKSTNLTGILSVGDSRTGR